MKTKPKRERVKKAWALVSAVGNIPDKFDSIYSIFAPRIYSTKYGAEKVAEGVVTGGARLKVVPVIITLKNKIIN